ncbi:MAG: gliding motility-associated C-terminal domain-containing protein, partial [Bacteroidales bacterium]|nr:gliding motility-associated C-terminal domain-containing protein [Bacteroidales bacterium]
GDQVQLSANASGGSEVYTYSWTSLPAGFTSSAASQIISPTVTTTYFVTVNDGYNTVSGSVTVTVNPVPIINNIILQHAINGQPNGHAEIKTIGGTPPYQYSLSGSNIWQIGSLFTGLLPGSYIVRVRDSNGCITQQSFYIYNYVLGEVEIIAGVIEGCLNSNLEAAVIANGFVNIAEFKLKINFDDALLRFQSIIDIHDALSNGSLQIDQPDLKTIVIIFKATDSVTILDGNLFKIQFTGVNTGQSNLQWDKPECYFYTVSGYEFPTIYIKGKVEIHPTPKIKVLANNKYCEGDVLTLVAQSNTSQSLNYYWQDPAGRNYTGSQLPLGALTVNHSGKYVLRVVNNFECDTIIEVPVVVNKVPVVKFAGINTDTICINGPYQLNPIPGGYRKYVWQDGSSGILYVASKEGIYWVDVYNEFDCKSTARVVVLPCDYRPQIFVNAFTPNGDGLNDTFAPFREVDNILNYSISIYNRWGQLIHTSKDKTKGWDGTYNGQLMPTGVYVFLVEYYLPAHFNDRTTQSIRGTVTLVR